MPLRSKGTKVCAVSAPQTLAQGRPSRAKSTTLARPSAPAHPRLPVTTHPVGLAFGLVIAAAEVEQAKAEELGHPSPESTASRKGAQRHLRDVRDRLRKHAGRDEERSLLAWLFADGGLSLRAIAAAGAGLRPYLVAGLLDGVQIARDHGIETRAARVLLIRGLSSLAVAAFYSARFAAEAESGDLAQLKVLGELRDRADVQGRLNLTTALQLANQYRLAPVVPVLDIDAMVRAHERRMADEARARGEDPDALDDDVDEQAEQAEVLEQPPAEDPEELEEQPEEHPEPPAHEQPVSRVEVQPAPLPRPAAESAPASAPAAPPRPIPGGTSGMPPRPVAPPRRP